MGKVNTNTATSYHQPSPAQPSISITNDTKFSGMRAERNWRLETLRIVDTRSQHKTLLMWILLNWNTPRCWANWRPTLSELAGWCIGCGNGQSIGKLVYNSQSGLSVLYSRQLELALIISSPCPRLVSSLATCATCHVSTVCRAGGWPACTARLTLLSPCRLSRSPDPDKLSSCIVYI